MINRVFHCSLQGSHLSIYSFSDLLFNRSPFVDVLTPVWISLKTAIAATIITFCLGVLAAWWMKNYRGRAKGIIEGIFTAPLVLPPTVVGFLLLLLLGRNGAIGQFLDLLGIRVIFTWYATVIAAVVVAFPLMYKSALAAFQQSDRHNLIACARTLGASETTIFWRIVLPLAKPGLISGTLLTFSRALGEFGATLMLAGSIPGKTQTIPIAIFFAAESGAMDRALGLVIILLVISLGVIVGVDRVDKENKIKSKNRGYQQVLTAPSPSRDIKPRRILEVDIQKQLPNFLLNITFKVDSQRPLGILGTSGAGKTTLLRCIAGLETPDRGQIILNGQILYDSAKGVNLPPQKRAVGFLFQDYALFPHLSVADNIAFGMPKARSPRAINQEVVHQLEQMNLAGMSDRLTTQLSGGEQQRVALARALASNPSITLLDEPFSALDSNLKAQLLKLWQRRLSDYSGLTIYVTHNLSEAYRLCPQLLIMDRGLAIASGRREDILNRPPNFQTAQIIGCNISTAKKTAPQTITAIDWQCDLQVSEIPNKIDRVAIHCHSITVTQTKKKVNAFPVWLATFSLLPHKVALYLKLHSSPNGLEDYSLTVEVSLARWQKLQQHPFPWYIQLPPSKIIVLES